MAISHLIAHRLKRQSPTSPADIVLREEELACDGKVEESTRELRLGFIKKLGKIHGRFSSDSASHPLASWLNEFMEEKTTFSSFTQRAMQHFKLELDKTEAVLDAFVFFVQERYEHANDLYIYVVQHNAGLYIDGDLNLADSLYLATDAVSLAAKVNLREWQEEDKHLNYLSLQTWRGEKDLSEAFSAFTGFTDKVDTKEETEAFLEAVDTYTNALPEEAAIEAKEAVVNYCLDQDKAGKRVVFAELSQHINEESPKDFERHIIDNKPQLKPELIPDRSQLRQYIRISGRNELLSMSFDSKCLGESIVYDSESDALIINKIPNALKSRLIKHIKSSK